MAAITEENFGRYLFLYRTEAVPKKHLDAALLYAPLGFAASLVEEWYQV